MINFKFFYYINKIIMDNLTFKLKNVSLEQDNYGHHLSIKMVQIYKDGKFWRNAKINAQLMETLKECTLVQDKKQNKLF